MSKKPVDDCQYLIFSGTAQRPCATLIHQRMSMPLPQQHVFVTDLFAPLAAWQEELDFTPVAPLLVKKLSRMTKHQLSFSNWLLTLYHLLGVNAAQKSLSHAENCFAFEFGKPAAGSVLCAAPIELEAGMTDIVVGASVIDDLSATDNQQLVKLLNAHFSQDDWKFVVSENGRWFLLLPEDSRPAQTIPISAALGNSLRALLEDTQSVHWSRQLNELQMLLYSSLTNQARESQRKRQVSSFWLWDIDATHVTQSAIRADETLQVSSVIGGGYEGQVIANSYGLEWTTFTGEPETSESNVYIIEGLATAANENNLSAWQQSLYELETFLVSLLDNKNTSTIIYTDNSYFSSSQKDSFIRSFFSWRKKTLLDFSREAGFTNENSSGALQ